MATSQVFKTKKRIKLGIWGLGRGMAFFKACNALNIDIVAGCDLHPHIRRNFAQNVPNAYVTDNVDQFLAQGFDAVLLATYCHTHADDAIKCLNAGKHVLSEVTAFHTPAEGVRLVEAVERSRRVYQLAENYPYSRENMWLAHKWKQGLFGELMYAEFEYVHECRKLAYTYGGGRPVEPGNQAHPWRSWLNLHYYNTHSLGPLMHITGLRPTRVTALPSPVTLAGFPMDRASSARGGVTPCLINMSNGGIVRNLMGATTNDTHSQRIWGTLGAAESHGDGLHVRLGASGQSPKHKIIARWDTLGDLASNSGHAGGDFWVLYYFARQILEGTPGPFDIYTAADCTLQGILAYRSALQNAKPYDIPDFRDPKQRDPWRNDHLAQERFDHVNGLFPADADPSVTLSFTATMKDLIHLTTTYRAWRDWSLVATDMSDPNAALPLADKLIASLAQLQSTQKHARRIADLNPGSTGARVLNEMLTLGDESLVSSPGFSSRLRAQRAKLLKAIQKALAARTAPDHDSLRWSTPYFDKAQVSPLFAKPSAGLKAVKPTSLSADIPWALLSAHPDARGFLKLKSHFADKEGFAYIAFRINASQTAAYDLWLGHDGGVHVWVNAKSVHLDPALKNPSAPDRTQIPIKLKRGINELIIAFDTDAGRGWGIFARIAIPKAHRTPSHAPALPTLL